MSDSPVPPSASVLPRAAARQVGMAAAVMPAVVVMGARQTGKSTLVKTHPALADYLYVTLDRSDVREQAKTAPHALLSRAPRMVLDEVQRDPALILAVKEHIDNQGVRTPGQFVLTGSANLLEMRTARESLAGRAAYVPLWPMTRRERLGFGGPGVWDQLADAPFRRWREIALDSAAPADDWRSFARVSGYPTPALDLSSEEARAVWYQGYVDTYLDRDLQDLAAIANRTDFRRLMRVAALRIGALVNKAEWGRDAGIPPTTADRYLDLLERSFQLVRLEAFAVNRGKRLIKASKAYWSDTALAMYLAGMPEPSGFHLENLVLTDLLAWRDSLARRPSIMHWRTASGDEVDFLIELPSGGLIGVECKGGPRPGRAETKGLQILLAEHRDDVIGTLVLHGGDETYQLGERILAVPWWRVV